MSTNERLLKLATADAATLALVDAALDHKTAETKPDRDLRLVTYTEVSRRLGISRPTVYRLVRAGRLRTVELCGVRRIVVSSLADFINVAN